METLKIQSTKHFRECSEAYKKYSIAVFEGSSRAAKTYNILIWLIVSSFKWQNKIIDICRKAFPTVRDTVMFDFFEILKNNNLYNEKNHNKTENLYRIGTNTFRFFGLDQEQKVRGRKRNIIFINEANELNDDDFKQLNQRTSELTIIDYNPSTEFGWFYDIQEQEGVKRYHSTYKDNPFLEERIKKAIEGYKETDENYWRIFGLGLRGVSKTTIFSNWEITKKEFNEVDGQVLFGMDFGFNDPTTLIRTKHSKGQIYFEELLYKRGLTSDAIVRELDKLREQNKLTYTDTITADSSRPEIINDIRKAGYNIHPTRKGKGSIIKGINFMKMHKILINHNSVNLLKEFKSYKWKTDKDNRVLDEPVDLNDHAVDGSRYSLETKYNETEFGVGGTSWTQG